MKRFAIIVVGTILFAALLAGAYLLNNPPG